MRRAQSGTGDTNFSNVVQTLDRAWSTAPFPGASSKVCGDLDAAVHWRSLATGCEELHWWSRTRHRVSSDGGHYNPWKGRDNRPSRQAAKTRFSASRGTGTASAAVRRPPQRLRGKCARRSDERLYCGFAEVAPRSTAGRPALQGREPGQVRKEAATAIHCKCRGNGSPPLLFVVQIDLILCCSRLQRSRTSMYVPRCRRFAPRLRPIW